MVDGNRAIVELRSGRVKVLARSRGACRAVAGETGSSRRPVDPSGGPVTRTAKEIAHVPDPLAANPLPPPARRSPARSANPVPAPGRGAGGPDRAEHVHRQESQ